MNILIDGLPESVEIGGAEYAINADFRTSILFELLMEDDELTDAEKAVQSLELYFPVIPEDLQDATDAIVWFYSCGDTKKKKQRIRDEDEDEEPLSTSDMVYSYEYDAPYIYAAFLEQYGIDLTEEDLHWWKFKALFHSLNEKTQIMKIMGYRGTKITSKMSKEQKEFYRKMKKLYELPQSQAEIDKQNAIREALIRGEDVSHLL